MKKALTIIAIVLVAYTIMVVIAWNKPPAGRTAWIETQTQRLLKFDPAIFDQSDVVANEGYAELFRFRDGGWIFTVSHCSHVVDMNKILTGRSGVHIGDIALAIDHRGNTYYSESHACGEIPINIEQKEDLQDLSHFFKCSGMFWRQANLSNQ